MAPIENTSSFSLSLATCNTLLTEYANSQTFPEMIDLHQKISLLLSNMQELASNDHSLKPALEKATREYKKISEEKTALLERANQCVKDSMRIRV